MSAIVSAKLLRIVSAFISTEETRYYLRGVFIQRHPVKGVFMVATDGHRMMVAHDGDATTDLEDIIVRLDKATLAACKPIKGETLERTVRIEGDGILQVLSGTYERMPVAMAAGCIIDGTFPDWRRVVPNPANTPETGCFRSSDLELFGKAATELGRDTKGSMTIVASGGNPALIRFTSCEHAFGVVMPVRGDGSMLPAFLNAQPQETRLAA